jgi:YHS domain-containing protein
MLRLAVITILALAACSGGAKPPTSSPPAKPTKILVNVDDRGVGLGGNDPIAYQKDNAATAGDASLTASFAGATYQFATADHKAAFAADPARTAPQYGGYCAFAASQNRLSESDPSVFLIRDGQLLVFTNEDYREEFLKDPAGNKTKADQNWPGLVDRYGK